ncbi:prion-like-(Q/N-rich) domain-bearing protein 25 isoform X4 [Dreissena polymorpha]|uniref:prion-like-(Q/N-rich) domain-bearing protein 25 isoform X4 n=1 Tax=Dreissena polymorpha TaxID=45954 RepID=UPI0022642418|nr:prion-like-(Q/N-rich) domain-bearing protein 25 isoform X4 [Dreissena polymorpha]
MAYSQLLKKLLVMALLQEIRTEFLLPSGKCNVPNGICETRCRCKEGFIALNESCLGKIGTTCTMQSDCIPEAACDDTFGGGTCTCNDGLVAYSNNTECRLKVGRPCNVTAAPHCIQNAECDVNGAKQNTCTCRQGFSVNNDKTKCLGNAGTACAATSECISKAVCSENKCTCEDLHVPSENGTKCIGYVGITCASTNECIQHAVCTGHTCTCEDMYASSEDKSTCIGYVGAICDDQSGTCVANAACNNGRCACLNGYQVEGYTCKAKVGTMCAATYECIRHAVCTGYTCSCEDSYTSSADSTTCIGHVGAICDQYSGTCVANAECINRHCACKNGYQADGNGSKTCKEKEDGSKVNTWIYIGSAAGFLIVLAFLAVVTCTVKRRKK